MIGASGGKIHETPSGPDELFCPLCNSDLRMACAERGGDRPPRAGDLTVCHECLGFLRYFEVVSGTGVALLRLDPIDDEALARLNERDQANLLQVRGELQIVKQARGSAQPTIYEAALHNAVVELQAKVNYLERAACSCTKCREGEPFSCHFRAQRGRAWV